MLAKRKFVQSHNNVEGLRGKTKNSTEYLYLEFDYAY